MCGDRLRDAARRDRKEGGRAADLNTVIGDAECLGAGGADQIEGGLDLVVAAEITLPPDDRGAFEEVAGRRATRYLGCRRCRRRRERRRRAASPRAAE